MNVTSFYRFVDVGEPGALAAALQAHCERSGLLGTILVAPEGVNGTLAGSAEAIQAILDRLRSALGLSSPIDARWTDASEAPFRRLRVRLKPEIVTLGRPDIRPHIRTGGHVEPRDWNLLLDDPATLVIDTRNRYEIELGTFPRAVDPGTDSFRQFSGFAEKLPEAERERPIAMFCTGGIRCEKASALMLEMGFRDVYQLQGGILNYLQQMDGDENRWRGECFVFDDRVAVDRDLSEGGYVQCHACRRPLSAEDLASPDYREGVCCPHCL
ncbi:MAG TPA: rhodanese-related sulfurtransferase [Woeseiaceae bacterium]|nr:rhodanese-related sulfurtransferase [Woeseiaceae bacterium]